MPLSLAGNVSPDVNALREMMRRGLLSEADLQNITVSNGAPNALGQMLNPQPQQPQAPQAPQFDLNSVTPGAGFQGMPSGMGVVQQTNEDGTQNAPIRINTPPPMPGQSAPTAARDWTRAEVDTPNGRGYYGKDGKIYTADGAVTSIQPIGTQQRLNDAADRARLIAKQNSDIEHTNAQTEFEREKLRQAQLPAGPEKAPPGYQWTAGGTLSAIPGGPADIKAGKEAEKEADAAKSTIDSASIAIQNIDAMIGKRDAEGKLVGDSKPHPGFETAVGLSGIGGGFGLAGFIPGTDTSNFKARLDQIKGGAFMQAYQNLKGGGQITEVEGKKATDAITRMSTSQSEPEFVRAATEFRQVLENGIKRAQEKVQTRSPVGLADKSRVLFEAQQAIRNGKDPELVKARLQQMGLSL